jgi:hypothetical protein
VAEVALVFAVFARKGQSIPMRSWRVAASFGVFVGSWMALSASPAFACSPSLPVPEPTDPAKIGLDSTPPVIFDMTVDQGCSMSQGSATPGAPALAGVLVDDAVVPARVEVKGTNEAA